MSIYSHGNRRVSTVIHSKRTGHFFKRCYRRLDLWEVRSILAWYRWFYNCLVMAYMLFMFASGVLRVISHRKYSTPLCFPILAQPALRAPRIISGFTDIRIVLKWGFIQAGAGVISNTWTQTKVKKLRKYANCIRLMRNSSWIKRRKGNCFTLYGSLCGLPAFIHKTRGDVFLVSNKLNRQT